MISFHAQTLFSWFEFLVIFLPSKMPHIHQLRPHKDASEQGACHSKGITLSEIWIHELAISHLSLAKGIKLLYKQLSM